MNRKRRDVRSWLGRAGSLVAVVAMAVLVAACYAPAGGGASAPPAGALALGLGQDATLGAHVTGKDGRSLYVFKMDSGGTSACTGDCASTWPPLVVGAAADVTAGTGVTGTLGTITRPDGAIQATLGGAPLYYYAGDSTAGDVKGQGLNEVWFLASPTGGQVGGAGASPGSGASPAASCGGRYCY